MHRATPPGPGPEVHGSETMWIFSTVSQLEVIG
jgi:hypothetical protein